MYQQTTWTEVCGNGNLRYKVAGGRRRYWKRLLARRGISVSGKNVAQENLTGIYSDGRHVSGRLLWSDWHLAQLWLETLSSNRWKQMQIHSQTLGGVTASGRRGGRKGGRSQRGQGHHKETTESTNRGSYGLADWTDNQGTCMGLT